MNIKDLAQKHEIIDDAELKTVIIDERHISYYHKLVTFNDDKLLTNGVIYAEYYVLDTTTGAEEALNYMQKVKDFYKLQKAVIGNRFFELETDLRYNLYLIIIINDLNNEKIKDTVKKLQKNDLRFFDSLKTDLFLTKKVFLEVSKVKGWFDMQTVLARGKKNEVTETQLVSEYTVNHIKSLKIGNNKCFRSTHILPFAKINLLTGENGSGKTTLIKAIREAITTEKNQEEQAAGGKIEELVCECVNNNLITFPQGKKELNNLSKCWYGKSKLELIDEFDLHNYLDMEDVQRYSFSKLSVDYSFLEAVIPEIKKLRSTVEKWVDKWIAINTEAENIGNIQKALESLIESFSGIKDKINIDLESWIEINEKGREHIDLINYQTKSKESKNKLLEPRLNDWNNIYNLLTNNRDYANIKLNINNKNNDSTITKLTMGKDIPIEDMSTGQRVSVALALLLACFISRNTVPNFIILDEPTVFSDPMHSLNLLDILRQLAITGTQIFYAAHSPQATTLFRRKFSFFRDDFKEFHLDEIGKKETMITMNTYSEKDELPKASVVL